MKQYHNRNTVKDLFLTIFLFNTVSQKDKKNPRPQGYMIPQYRTLKSKLPINRAQKAQNHDTVNPMFPL